MNLLSETKADVDECNGKILADELGPAASFKKTDVTAHDDLDLLMRFTVSHFGSLDVMWNNAGFLGRVYPRLCDDALSDFENVMAINVFGFMLVSRLAASYMKNHGGAQSLTQHPSAVSCRVIE